MQLSTSDKRWLQIFKSFAEKALIPQIRQANGSLAEWQIFQSLISAPNINQNQLQLFVDSLPPNSVDSNAKRVSVKKQPDSYTGGNQYLYANKSFGGQKNKVILTSPSQDIKEANRRQSYQQNSLRPLLNPSNSGGLFANLEKIIKGMQENQQYIQNLEKENDSFQNKSNRLVFNQIQHNGPSNIVNTSIPSAQQYYQVGQASTGVPSYYRTNY